MRYTYSVLFSVLLPLYQWHVWSVLKMASSQSICLKRVLIRDIVDFSLVKVALRWNICMSRNSYPLYIKKRICEFQKMLAVIKVNVLVDLHHLNFSFSIFLMLCIHMVYIHPSSLLLQSKEEKRPNLPFCWMFRIFRPLYLSVCVHVFFGWLFTKITYSTLVPFHHILDITYHVILHSNACCSIHLPLSHMWKPFIYTYKTAFCPALLIFFFHSFAPFARLLFIHTLCYFQCTI